MNVSRDEKPYEVAEDDDGDHRPRKTRAGKGVPVWVWVAAGGFALCVLVCGGGGWVALTAARKAAREAAQNVAKEAEAREAAAAVAPPADANPNAAPPAPPLDSAGVMKGDELADAWEADGANRAQVKEKYFGKRWTVDLCENLSIQTDHVAIRVHSNMRWVTTRIYFRNPKEVASIDWVGSRGQVRVNARCKDEFTFVDAVIVQKTPEELTEIREQNKRAKIAEVQRKISQKQKSLSDLQGQLNDVMNGRYKYDKESEKERIISGIKSNIATCEAQIRSLEDERRKIEAE